MWSRARLSGSSGGTVPGSQRCFNIRRRIIEKSVGLSKIFQHKYNIPEPQLFFMNPVSRIILDPLVLTGKPVIRGTRISVDVILELLASAWNESSILKEYPGLEHEDILACIRYAQEIVRDERVYATPHQGKITG